MVAESTPLQAAVKTMADEFPEEMPAFDLEPEPEPAVPEMFRVKDEESANWVARKILEARAYAARVKAWAEKEAGRAKKEEEFFLRRFGPEMEAWAQSQLAGGKKKSINLPAGVVGFHKQAAALVVDDDPALLAWAKQAHPELVVSVTKESVPKTDLGLLLKRSGELPPDGVAHIEPEAEAFYVKPAR